MSFLFRDSPVYIPKGKTRYDIDTDLIITFNLSGQKTYSFCNKTLAKFPESELYHLAFNIPEENLCLDENNFIYLDLCPDTFKHIHDFMKDYSIPYEELSLSTKKRIHQDAQRLKLKPLEDDIKEVMPNLSVENIRHWSNLIAKGIISSGLTVEHIYKCINQLDMPYPLATKLRVILETNEDIRDQVRKCVVSILEYRSQEGSPIDKLLIMILNQIGQDVNPISFLDQLIAKFNP